MFKQIMVVTLILAVCASIAGAQTVKVEWNESSTSIDLFWRGDGAFIYALDSRYWSEAYAGATFSPAPWVDLGLGIGIEQADDPIRFGGWIWLGQGDVSFCHLFEDGGSGPWHKTTVAYQATSELSLGLIDRSFYGRGITAEYKLSDNTNITAAMYDSGRYTVSLGYSF